MNSKERIRNTVRHQPSDRVPTLYSDVSWISLPNTRTNRPDGGFLDSQVASPTKQETLQ